MAFAPLHQLFTTKEDRVAVYKALQVGMKPRKSKDLFRSLTNAYVGEKRSNSNGYYLQYEEYLGSEMLTKEASANSKDKAEELAKKTGVDLLTIKQFMFCDLMAEAKENASDGAQPFLCSTVEEIDSLGRKTFGALWECEASKKDDTYCVEYTKKEINDLLEKAKIPNIKRPFVYQETFGTMPDYSDYGLCTLIACIYTGACIKDAFDEDEWGFEDLKDYLNNKPDRKVSAGMESVLEQGFFFNLFAFRAQRFMKLRIASGFMFRNFIPGPVLPEYVFRYENDEMWGAYRNALLGCYDYLAAQRTPFAEAYSIDADDVPIVGSREEKAFFVDEIWFRYLHKDYAHLLTKIPMISKNKPEYYGDTYVDHRLIVVADASGWPYKDSRGYIYGAFGREWSQAKQDYVDIRFGNELARKYHSPACYVRDNEEFLYDVSELPWDLNREEMLGVLSYTGYLYRVLWDWDAERGGTCHSEHKDFGDVAPKMLITNSCLISPLRRGGAELYFAFRAEDSVAEPLVLYVENEEDKAFVEECAKSVGASLCNGKNSIVMLNESSAGKLPVFTELDATLDTMTKEELFEELIRVTFLMLPNAKESVLMSSARNFRPISQTLVYTKTEHSEKDNLPNKALFSLSDSDSVTRNTMLLRDMFADSYTLRTGEVQAYNLTTKAFEEIRSFSDCSEQNSYVVFHCAYALTTFDGGRCRESLVTMPLLVKGGFCKYVRWEELVNLVPELSEDWSYIDSMSMLMLRTYATASLDVDIRRK